MHENWSEAFAECGRVVELSRTHHLVISNRGGLVKQTDVIPSRLSGRNP